MNCLRWTACSCGALIFLAVGCPDAEEGGGPSCSTNDDCLSLGMGYVCMQGTCVAPSASTGEATDATTEPQTGSSSDGSSSTGSPTTGDPTTNSSTTGTPDDGSCEPASGPFLDDEGILRNSVSFDFGAMTCAVTQLGGQEPRIVLDVRETTGRIDATSFGIEITDSNLGQVFADPPMGDTQVIDLPIDLPIEFTGMSTADGTPLHFEFEVFMGGPALIDCAATFE